MVAAWRIGMAFGARPTVVATMPVGRDAAPIAVGDGRVWVAREGDVSPH